MKKNKPESIEYSVWWKPGTGMMYNREALSPDHPEYVYNYLKREFGVDPEDYGVYHPINMTKEYNAISDLRRIIKERRRLILAGIDDPAWGENEKSELSIKEDILNDILEDIDMIIDTYGLLKVGKGYEEF